MITRRALLIGAPGKGKLFLPGVPVDLRKMKEFLMSPQGGAWYEHEIITLYNPTEETVQAYVHEMSADYTLTHFSGHGFSDSDGNRFLSLLNNDFIQDLELLNQSTRQLVLLDSCRNVIATGISGLEMGDPFEHFDGVSVDLARSRRVFNKLIENCKPGKVILHSTTHGNYSFDTRNGGIFTQKLIDAGKSVPVSEKIMANSIIGVGDRAARLIKSENLTQKPVITYRQGNIRLPFALSLPEQTVKPRVLTKKSQDNTGVFLGLLLLGLIVAAAD